MARRTSLTGDTLEPRPAVPDSNQTPPHPGFQSSITLTTPLQPDYLTNEDQNSSLIPPLQDIKSTTSASFAHVQPLQNRPDHFQPNIAHSHYQFHNAHHDQEHPSGSANENQGEAIVETSVVVRTTTLVPSSPLLKSTVTVSPTSELVSHHYPQSEYLIQADPTSPYYTFQDPRLMPNPIIRIYMANSANPKMFSLQNISPDTLSLLLSVLMCSSKEAAYFVNPFQPVPVCFPPHPVRHLLSCRETPSDHPR